MSTIPLHGAALYNVSTMAKPKERVHPDIERIEGYRVRLDLPHVELCDRSGVRKWTWARLRRGLQQPRKRTIERLDRALEEAIEARRGEHSGSDVKVELREAYKAEWESAVEALGHSGVFRRERFAPEDVRPTDKQLALLAREIAIYRLYVQGRRPGLIATAIDMTRQGVHAAIRRVRERYDPKWIESLGSAQSPRKTPKV